MSEIGRAGAKLIFDGMLAGLEMTRAVKMSKMAREEIEVLKASVRAMRDNPPPPNHAQEE